MFTWRHFVFSGLQMNIKDIGWDLKLDDIVWSMRCNAVTFLFIDKCILRCRRPAWTQPLFPNLQTLKFRGCRWITASETYASIYCLLPLMSGTSIKFLEISYGLLPYCCGVHGEKSPDANMDTTWFREGRKETGRGSMSNCQLVASLYRL